MRFHRAMATLEPQKYVIAGTVGTEKILLVSGRLVRIFCVDVKFQNLLIPQFYHQGYFLPFHP